MHAQLEETNEMEKAKTNRRGQTGQALLTAIMFLLILTFLGFALVTVATIDIHSSRNLRLAEEAFFVADRGALYAVGNASDILRQPDPDVGQGDTIRVNSIGQGVSGTNDRHQFEVLITNLGQTGCGLAGLRTGRFVTENVPGGAGCKMVRVQSMGLVDEGPAGILFVWTRPQVRRRVEMYGRYFDPLAGFLQGP